MSAVIQIGMTAVMIVRHNGKVTLGHTGRRYPTVEELYAAALSREPSADPERRVQLRLEVFKNVRRNVAFLT